jgi:hypothetical protein
LRLLPLRVHSPGLTGVMVSNLFWLTDEQMDR